MNYEQLSPWLTVGVCLVVSAYLLILFHSTTNLTDLTAIPTAHYIILLLGVLIPLFPFVRRLRVGKLVELERGLQDTKAEVKDFKSEVRQMVSVISTSVNSISNLTSTTNVNLDFADLLRQAREQLSQAEPPQEPQEVQDIKDQLLLEDEDTIMALARTRIRLEYLLRRILGKKTSLEGASENVKFLTAGRLYRLFLQQYPKYQYLKNSFEYVLKICNAAIHGQTVPYGQAEEALDLGARLISTLDDIAVGEWPNQEE